MEKNEILKGIEEILSEIIDNENLVLEETSSTSSVENWDSLAHFQLVMELQQAYDVKFNAAEILGWKNVGDIIQSIENKQKI